MKNKNIYKNIQETLNSDKPSKTVLDKAIIELGETKCHATKANKNKWQKLLAISSFVLIFVICLTPIIKMNMNNYRKEHINNHPPETIKNITIKEYSENNKDKLKNNLLCWDYEIVDANLIRYDNDDVYLEEKYLYQNNNIILYVLLDNRYEIKEIDKYNNLELSIVRNGITIRYKYDDNQKTMYAQFNYNEIQYFINSNDISLENMLQCIDELLAKTTK